MEVKIYLFEVLKMTQKSNEKRVRKIVLGHMKTLFFIVLSVKIKVSTVFKKLLEIEPKSTENGIKKHAFSSYFGVSFLKVEKV